jgi:hypothetical protein
VLEQTYLYRREVLKSLYRRGIILGCVMLETDRVYISYMAIAVILCAALLSIAKIFKQEVRENEAG